MDVLRVEKMVDGRRRSGVITLDEQFGEPEIRDFGREILVQQNVARPEMHVRDRRHQTVKMCES